MQCPPKLSLYIALMRLNKPIGIYLCLWPALWALWLSSHGQPSLTILLVIITGGIVVRSAGCIINDFFDRDIDHRVERTRTRPLTSGAVSTREALLLFIILGLIALGLVFYLNPLSLLMAFFAGLLTTLYPLAKRFTHLPQLVLGFTFNTGILIAFAATQNALPPAAWMLYATAILWTVAYDTTYAIADRRDDILAGVKSTAVLSGKNDLWIIAGLQVLMIFMLGALAYDQHLLPAMIPGLFIIGALFLYQYWLTRHRDSLDCIRAFKNNQFVGLTIFLVFFIHFC